MQLQPGEQHRGTAGGGHLPALRRVVVGEEREAALVGAAQQDVARLRPTLLVDGAEHECVGFRAPGLARLAVPTLPLHHRVGVDIGHVEPSRLVVEAVTRQVGERAGRRLGGHRGPITVVPRMYCCSTCGTATVPSAWR